VDEVEFHQVESEEQKEEAGSLIREYLKWLIDCNDTHWKGRCVQKDIERSVLFPAEIGLLHVGVVEELLAGPMQGHLS
jgi:hypothetical protein